MKRWQLVFKVILCTLFLIVTVKRGRKPAGGREMGWDREEAADRNRIRTRENLPICGAGPVF